MSHVRGDVRKHGGEADVCENCRPLLDAITAERNEALAEVMRQGREVVALGVRAEKTEAEVAALTEQHRDLTRRLGFGDNVSEPMADNDTIVKWYEEQSRDANEWQESQLWRDDCYEKGHPELEDCFECDPSLRLAALTEQIDRVKSLADEMVEEGRNEDPDYTYTEEVAGLLAGYAARLRAALDGDS